MTMLVFITKRSERNESLLSFPIRQLADGKIGFNTRYFFAARLALRGNTIYYTPKSGFSASVSFSSNVLCRRSMKK